jgi:hypothetical protein
VRVGIITFHNSYNFGSALQAYALQTAVGDMGHEATIIDYRSRNFDQYLLLTPRHPRQTLKVISHFSAYVRRRQSFRRFWTKWLRLTSRHYKWTNEGQLEELPAQFDAFVCGSDQIWNLDATQGVVGPYFLSFAGNRRRVAYAPSLAHTSFRPEYFDKRQVAALLGMFDAISVRERETVGLFQPLVGKKIKVTLDPTLLLSADTYRAIATPRLITGDYVFVYQLADCPEMIESVIEVAAKCHTRVVYVSEHKLPIQNSVNLFGVGPEDFVSLVANADRVFTNSFHATVFSLLFHRPFQSFSSDGSGSRMRDLLGSLGLESSFSDHKDIDPLPIIDWDDVDRRIAHLRDDSLRFLREALA